MVTLSILAVAVVLALVDCQATRAGYEPAPYQVVCTDGKFELRNYPALMVVETPMARTGSDADGSFNRLFGFHHRPERGETKNCHDDAGVHVR